ncbi:MAG TPA: tRNA preQ1(34) S-adenosylmethionine ribosyltransferase-isomerase QueA [Gemmatimonadales bacterium]|nr:tRNA preQ1(34) S-adenosylmethionine ribosyltransferase-isomerase QueA [Gemmatimonadales bacterium]
MSLQTSDFDYTLPPELIAQEPTAERGASRLLVVGSGFTDATFTDLPALVPAGDLLVLNTTRVRHARFLGTRESGAPAEVLLIHPGTGDHWIAIGKPGSALRPGKRIAIAPGAFIETVAVLDEGYREVRFVGITADAAMHTAGRLPLPPYIERDPTADDETRYQTVYAEREGSVAAPTAGLHFTPDILRALEQKGVEIARLDLEVGPGTFKPVEVDDPSKHPMHPEWFEIPEATADAIARLRRRGGKLWAVGTTVVRSLESAARKDGTVEPGRRETRLLITPGYRFRVVDRLITNFHLPRSTLLMLVSAFGGRDRILAAYRHAVEQRYRFYSYGDAMVVWPDA